MDELPDERSSLETIAYRQAQGREPAGERKATVVTDQVRLILEERAHRLSQPPPPPPPTDNLDVVVFLLGGETYGVNTTFVEEVFRLAGRSALPGATEPIVGVTAHRGELLTLLDLRTRLGLRAAALDDLSRVLVLRRGHTCVGVLVDRVEGLQVVRSSQLRQPPGQQSRHEYFLGVTPDVLAVLDADAILRSFDGGDAS